MFPALFHGRPIVVRYSPNLRDTAGNPAHAATYIRRRLIVLDPDLKHDPRERERILLHEHFHFVWVRLGNPRRHAWEALLRAEWESRARGEAGWSAEWRKRALRARDVAERSRLWREYCCESFCDTGAFLNGRNGREVTRGVTREVTLSRTRLAARAAWFRSNLGGGAFPI